ncbi:MAG: phosphate ABC transporter permease subunit PstC [Acidobacteria bacterium]|nr:phosphate ABC transporter permease subunit PstC [Acidobacteriota bacterium]
MDAAVPILRRRRALQARVGDLLGHWVTAMCAAVVVAITVLIAYELWSSSAMARRLFGFAFLFEQHWDPVAGRFGAAPFVYGTLVTSALALLFAVPLGLGAAIFLAELAPPRLSRSLGLGVELLAGVPSVIYGLVGLAVLVPIMREWVEPGLQAIAGFLPLFSGPIYGVGYLTAGLVLAAMVLPFIVSVGREVLLAVPRDQREAALALGATRWETIAHVVVPYARVGLLGGIMLALGRALGETMAVTMVIGSRPEIALSLFAPGHSMAAVIANEFTEAADELYLQALVEIGLVLFGVTMAVNGLARLMIARIRRAGGGR